MQPIEIPPDDFLPAILEAERRPVRISQLEVIDHTEQFRPDALSLGAPGTMTVFVGRKGTGAIEDVRAALTGQGDINKVLFRLRRFSVVPFGRAFVEVMLQQPVFADIRYGGEVLNRGIFLPKGFDLVLSVFPYNGGRLARDGFSLAEHYTEDSDATVLNALVVQVSPPLTAAESAALRLVPEDQLVLNVGPAAWCKTTWWVVGIITLAAAVVAGGWVATTAATMAVVAPGEETHLTSDEIDQLGPAASARTLLTRRHELLLRNISS